MKPNIKTIVIIIILIIAIYLTVGSWGSQADSGTFKKSEVIALEENPYHQIYMPTRLLLIYNIIECESSWNENAIGKAGEIGLAQYFPETFNWLSVLAGVELDIYDPSEQIWLLNWALDHNYGYLWSCARTLGYVKQ